jgi:hypothetical protein
MRLRGRGVASGGRSAGMLLPAPGGAVAAVQEAAVEVAAVQEAGPERVAG